MWNFLRETALDHLAHQLVLVGSPSITPSRKIEFPILDSKEEYLKKKPGKTQGDTEASVLPEREHLEAVFYKEAEIAESGLKGRKDHSCSTKKIEIEDIRLFSGQVINDRRTYVEFQEFQETKGLHLLPSDLFKLICELKGEPGLSSGDFLLWTAVEFFVAPVTPYYEKMKADQIDLKAVGTCLRKSKISNRCQSMRSVLATLDGS
jgi:hypothetical protein